MQSPVAEADLLASQPRDLESASGGGGVLFLEGGAWQQVASAELYGKASALAAALEDYGVTSHDAVAVLATRGEDALLASLAGQELRAISVPVDPRWTDDRIREILRLTQSRIVFVSDELCLQRLLSVRPDLPDLDLVLLFHPSPGSRAVPAMTVEAACANGLARLEQDPDRSVSLVSSVRGGETVWVEAADPGSPENPSAHRYSANSLERGARSATELLGLGPGDRILLVLPPGSILSRTLAFAGLDVGAQVAFAEPGRIVQGLATLQPQLAVVGTDAIDALALALKSRLETLPWPRRFVLRKALHQGYARVTAIRKATRLGVEDGWGARLAEGWILGSVRSELTGGRLRRLVSVGRLVEESVSSLLLSLGVPLLESLERPGCSTLIASNVPDAVRPGTWGRPAPGLGVFVEAGGTFVVAGDSLARPGGLAPIDLAANGEGGGARVLRCGRGLRAEPDGYVVPGA